MSIFARLSDRRRARRSTSTERPVSAMPQPVQPPVRSTPAASTATAGVHRHGSCPVKHRTAAAAQRCRNS